MEEKIPSVDLFPVHHMDELEFFPGSFVIDAAGRLCHSPSFPSFSSFSFSLFLGGGGGGGTIICCLILFYFYLNFFLHFINSLNEC